jgi:hypothetical protein
LALEEVWGDEGVVAANAPILRVLRVADRLVLNEELDSQWRGGGVDFVALTADIVVYSLYKFGVYGKTNTSATTVDERKVSRVFW